MFLRVAQYACRPSKSVLSRKFRYKHSHCILVLFSNVITWELRAKTALLTIWDLYTTALNTTKLAEFVGSVKLRIGEDLHIRHGSTRNVGVDGWGAIVFHSPHT